MVYFCKILSILRRKMGLILIGKFSFGCGALGLGLSCLVLGPALAPYDKEINVQDSLFKTILHYIFFLNKYYSFFPLIRR